MHSFLIVACFLAILFLPCVLATSGESAWTLWRAEPEQKAEKRVVPKVEQVVAAKIVEKPEEKRAERRKTGRRREDRVRQNQTVAVQAPAKAAPVEAPVIEDPYSSAVMHRRAILLKCARVSQLKQIHLASEPGKSRAA